MWDSTNIRIRCIAKTIVHYIGVMSSLIRPFVIPSDEKFVGYVSDVRIITHLLDTRLYNVCMTNAHCYWILKVKLIFHLKSAHD